MNNIPSGYKQTEVGVIPEDWEVNSLGQLGMWKGGATPSMQNPSFWENGAIPWVSSGDVKRSLLFDAPMKITSHAVKNSSTTLLPANSIIIVTRSGILRKYLPVAKNALPLAINQDIKALIPIANHVPDYLLHLLLWSGPQILARCMKSGTTVESIEFRWLKSFVIPLPPTKAEQEAIAEALSDADALIESLEQLLAKKHHLKQGAMQELLTGKKRLPGFSGEWEERSLFDLAGGKKELFDDGDWIESEHITDKGIRLIQTGNIGVGAFIEKDDKKYIFEKSFVSLRCKEISQGDLLICRLADPAGRSCVLSDIGEAKIVTSVDVTIFRPPASVANRVFLANIFSTDQWFRAVSDRSGGTTHKRISRGALGRLRIRVPTVEEQTAIAAILSDMDAEIAALEEKLAKARSLKQGMMQDLLTGRIRLI